MNKLVKRYAVVGSLPPQQSALKEDFLYYQELLQHVRICINSLPDNVTIISGCAGGVDSEAIMTASSRSLDVVEHLPNYKTYNDKMISLVRNIIVVNDCDMLLAFPAAWSTSTWHAIRIARDTGKMVQVFQLEPTITTLKYNH